MKLTFDSLSLCEVVENFFRAFFAFKFLVDYKSLFERLKARFLVEFLNLCNFFIIHPYGLAASSFDVVVVVVFVVYVYCRQQHCIG